MPLARLRVPFLSLLLLVAPAALLAQVQATTGVIRGNVSAADGSPLAGATVVARNVNTNFTRTLTTNARGVYAATLLPLGTYQVTARAVGYRAETQRGLRVSLGEEAQADFRLEAQAVQLGDIAVESGEPPVDVTASQSATSLPVAAVEGLPNNGRNILNFTTLTPNVGIVQGPDGDEISIGGQRGIHNNVSVDGADFNNPFFGEQRGGQRPPFTFNLDAVQEFVVVSGGANAEFGRSSGGFVNVITKSGTNQLRGSAHYYGKDGAFSGQPRHGNLSEPVPDFSQHQFGFTLGGPVKRDRAWFFVAYDQQLYDEIKQTDVNRIDPQLRAWMDTAYGGALAGDYGPITRTNDARALMAKV